MKFLEYCKKHKTLILILGIVLILTPPILIHILFSIYPNHDILVAKWSAGELLNYFGSIIGAIATIIAVVMTIIYTKYSQDEQNILQVKPYLQSEYIPIFKYTDLDGEYVHQHTFITIEKGLTTSSYDEPFLLKPLKNNSENKFEFFQNNYMFKYRLKNVGANSSTNIKWTLNNEPLIPEFAISTGKTKEFIIIISKSVLENNKKDLRLEFIYDDVLSMATYSQKEIITIVNLSNGLSSTQKIEDVLSSPKRIK